MTAYFQYLLNVNLSLIILYLGYRFMLQQSHYFKGIRYFFLIGILVSLLFPLLNMESVIAWEHINLNTIQQVTFPIETTIKFPLMQSQNIENTNFTIIDVIAASYWLISVLLLLSFAFKLNKLYLLITSSNSVQDGKYKISLTSDKSFTFLQQVILGRSWFNLSDDEKSLVLAHEKQHAKDWHSLDVLLIQVLQTLCWFNPAVWLLGKSVSLNHEYLVDDEILRNTKSIKAYSTLLIEQALPQKGSSMVQSFSQFSNLKKRINMMTSPKSQSKKSSIYLSGLILVSMLFACNLTDVKEPILNQESILQEGESIAFFLDQNRIDLKKGISKEFLLNESKIAFHILLDEEKSENLKSVNIYLAKGRKALGKMEFGEQYLASDLSLNISSLMTEDIIDSLKLEGTCRFIIEMSNLNAEVGSEIYTFPIK